MLLIKPFFLSDKFIYFAIRVEKKLSNYLLFKFQSRMINAFPLNYVHSNFANISLQKENFFCIRSDWIHYWRPSKGNCYLRLLRKREKSFFFGLKPFSLISNEAHKQTTVLEIVLFLGYLKMTVLIYFTVTKQHRFFPR
jgi:hypothetical protein